MTILDFGPDDLPASKIENISKYHHFENLKISIFFRLFLLRLFKTVATVQFGGSTPSSTPLKHSMASKNEWFTVVFHASWWLYDRLEGCF